MDWTTNVSVHESASPEFIRDRVLASLRESRVHPHLLYSGLRQSTLWMALHHSVSPAQRDESCGQMYDTAFKRVTDGLRGNVAHVVSLACGDGSKDVRCLQQIRASHRPCLYTPVDISLELVLTAARNAADALRGLQSNPLLCDLPRCSVLPAVLKGFDPAGAERVILFLGTIHNFWPPDILKSIIYPLRAQDQLLLSANLAPKETYDEALAEILGQYDNRATRAWLMGALSELGFTGQDGELRFQINPTPEPALKKIEAIFRLKGRKCVSIYDETFELEDGREISVFFSHRFTPEHIRGFVEQAGLVLLETWVGAGGQEGLFLCKRPG